MPLAPRKIILSRIFVLLAICSSSLLVGCQNYNQQTAEMVTAYRYGNVMKASQIATTRAAASPDNKDAVLNQLEEGAILRTASLAADSLSLSESYLKASNTAFDLAEAKINAFEAGPAIKVGSDLAANFSTQANAVYRGRAYDKVLMNTYKALNYLQLGDYAAARVEINRSLDRQRNAVVANSKQIEQAEAAALAAKQGTYSQTSGQNVRYDLTGALKDPRLQSSLNQIESDLESRIVSTYADYVNPFAVFLDGLFHLYRGVDAADLERSRKSFERVAQMVPANPYITADLEAAQTGKLPDGITYVIFETGLGPWRDEVRIDVPSLIVTQTVSYIGAAFPKLRYSSSYLTSLRVSSGSSPQLTTASVADMDSVVAQDFANEWPSIVTRTLIASGTKLALDATLQKQARDNLGAEGQLLVGIFSALTQAAVNIADTRTWRTLPKEFQYARIATPADRQLFLETNLSKKSITIEPGTANVVYVKSITPIAPLQIAQFRLK